MKIVLKVFIFALCFLFICAHAFCDDNIKSKGDEQNVTAKFTDVPNNLKADYDSYIESEKKRAIEEISRGAYSIGYADWGGGTSCQAQSKQNSGRVVTIRTSTETLFCLDGKADV